MKKVELQFQPALLDYNDYVGRIGVGRVQRGKIELMNLLYAYVLMEQKHNLEFKNYLDS